MTLFASGLCKGNRRHLLVLGDATQKGHYARENLDTKALDEPWYMLNKDPNEERRKVFGCKCLRVISAILHGNART